MPHGCAGMCVPTQTRRFPQANLESACLAGPRTPALCPERENCFSPCPLLQGKLCLLSVGSISSHLSQTLGWRWPVVTVQAAMASDVPGAWGRRVWLGTFIQGCCAASTRKGQENPALVWQWLQWAVPTQPPMAGWGRGSPGSSVHPKLRLIRVSEVLGDPCLSGPCAWGMSWPEEGMCSVQGFSCPGSWLVVDAQSLAAAEGVLHSALCCLLLTVN